MYYQFLLYFFFILALADVLSLEIEWKPVSRTLLTILADLNYAVVVWMISTCPLISKFSSPFTKLLGVVPSAPISRGITVIFMFLNFFSSPARSKYLSLFSLSFIATLWSPETAKCTIWQVPFFFFVDYHEVWSFGRGLVIRLYFQIPENLVHLILQYKFLVVHGQIWFAWSNFSFLHNSQ